MLARAGASIRRGATLLTIALVITIAFALLLMFLGVVPLRSYQAQKSELQANRARLAMLRERNDRLEDRVALLQTDTEIQRLAREQFNMVKPGQSIIITPGLRGDGTRLINSAIDEAVAPAPSAKQQHAPSKGRAVLETLMFWK